MEIKSLFFNTKFSIIFCTISLFRKDESVARYVTLVSSLGSWLGNIAWKSYGSYTQYLTLPGKGLPVYFNGSSTTMTAVMGNIAAIGAGETPEVLASKQG